MDASGDGELDGQWSRAQDEFGARVDTALGKLASSIDSGRDFYRSHLGLQSTGDDVNKLAVNEQEAEGSSERSKEIFSVYSPKKYRAWDFDCFLRRIDTYSALTWAGKMNIIGPGPCAAYGYENTGKNELTCVLCNVCVKFRYVSGRQSEEDYSAKFLERLQSSHKSFCSWKKNFTNHERAQKLLNQYFKLSDDSNKGGESPEINENSADSSWRFCASAVDLALDDMFNK